MQVHLDPIQLFEFVALCIHVCCVRTSSWSCIHWAAWCSSDGVGDCPDMASNEQYSTQKEMRARACKIGNGVWVVVVVCTPTYVTGAGTSGLSPTPSELYHPAQWSARIRFRYQHKARFGFEGTVCYKKNLKKKGWNQVSVVSYMKQRPYIWPSRLSFEVYIQTIPRDNLLGLLAKIKCSICSDYSDK